MIKKQSSNKFIDNMNLKKAFGLFFVIGLFVSLGSAAIPSVPDTSVSNRYPADFETVDLDMSGEDDTGITNMTVEIENPDGNIVQTFYEEPTGEPLTYDLSSPFQYTFDSGNYGEWQVIFTVYDNEGFSRSGFKDISYTQEGGEPQPTWNLISPNDGQIIDYPASETGADVSFETEVTPENDGTVGLFIDFDGDGSYPVDPVYTDTVFGGTTNTVSTTELISNDPDIDYTWNYNSDVTNNDFNSPSRTFSVQEVDNLPTINSISTDPSSPQVGQSTDVTVEASDDIGLQSFLLTVTSPDGSETSTSGSISGTSDTFTVGNFFTPSSTGDYEIEVTVEDNNQQTTTDTSTVSVSSENSPTFTLDSPSNNEVFSIDPSASSTTVNYDGTVDSSFDGTVRLYRDGTQVGNPETLVSGGDSYSFSESLSTGNYSYKIQAESDATGEIYESNTLDFEVVQSSEAKPNFNLNNPSNGETISYGEAEPFADVVFSGSVEAPWNGQGNLSVQGTNISGSVKLDFVHTSDQTFYQYNETLTNGSYSYYFEIISEDTGKRYESDNISFDVVQTDEPVPTQTIVKPVDSYNSNKLVEPIDYDVEIDSEIDGLTTLVVDYPESNYTQQVGQASITSGFTELNGSFQLVDTERIAGTYNFEVRTDSSNTTNVYVESKRFVVSEKPVFEELRPNNETIIMDEAQRNFHNTDFFANISYVSEGVLIYEVREPESTEWIQVERGTVNEFSENTVLDFDAVVDGFEFIGTDENDRKFTGNYSGRVRFVSDRTQNSYSSGLTTFNYKEPELTGLNSVERFIENILGDEFGLPIFATILVILSIVYVGVISESASIVIGTMILDALIFVLIGWYPAWLGFLIAIALVVLLSKQVGGDNG